MNLFNLTLFISDFNYTYYREIIPETFNHLVFKGESVREEHSTSIKEGGYYADKFHSGLILWSERGP